MAEQLRLTLLSRSWCHLCDDLLAVLLPLQAEFAFILEVRDMDRYPDLDERWGEHVPVLMAGESELVRHRATPAELRGLLADISSEIG